MVYGGRKKVENGEEKRREKRARGKRSKIGRVFSFFRLYVSVVFTRCSCLFFCCNVNEKNYFSLMEEFFFSL